MNIKELKVRLDELYTSNNSALLNYIKHSGEFDWDYYTEEFFCDWYATLPQFGKEELADVLNTDVEELSTTPPDNGWYKNTKLFADNFKYFYGEDEYSTASAVTLPGWRGKPRGSARGLSD